MLKLALLACLVCWTSAKSLAPNVYIYKSDNHLYVQEDYPVMTMEGVYRFTADDGQTYTTLYVANDKGYYAQGSHIPGNPKIPLGYSVLAILFPEIDKLTSGPAPEAMPRSNQYTPLVESYMIETLEKEFTSKGFNVIKREF